MMARQNVRLPILTIERIAPFLWVSLGLWEADGHLTTPHCLENEGRRDHLEVRTSAQAVG